MGVLYGSNGAFCAGADLKEVSTGTRPRMDLHSIEGPGPLGPSRMLLSKPVIAAVEGHAVAGGLELALWCDMRIADETAVFGVYCRRWGVPLVDGGTIRLPRLIGLSRALDMILTGRGVDAQEALAMGLANRVVPKGTARQEAEKLAHDLTRFPERCMYHDRLSAYEQFSMTLDEALLNELRHGSYSLTTETLAGAARFAGGKGRGGAFDDI